MSADRARLPIDTAAYRAGQHAADNIALNKGLNGSASSTLAIGATS